jgi:hypothetical protein
MATSINSGIRPWWLALGAAAWSAVSACGEVNSSPPDAPVTSTPDAPPGDSPDAPPGDTPDAGVDAPVPVCEPGTVSCTNETLTTCSEQGEAVTTPCALGCFTDNTRCWDVAPSAGLGGQLDSTTDKPAVTLPDGVTIDTDTGAIRSADGTSIQVPSVLVAQGTGRPQIRVFQVGSLTMGSATVRGVQLLAVVSNGAIELRGAVTFAYHGLPRAACAGGDGLNAGGGGGGGQVASGGAGGLNRANPGGIAGRPSAFEDAFVLAGGCAGGSYTAYDEDAGQVVVVGGGGSGGGAVQLVSRTRIALVASGGINVGGSGGVGGGGGGSGGLIVLEAPVVELAQGAALAANGGGGGGTGSCTGSRGGNGRLAEAAASGGWCIPGVAGGAGGYGAEGSGTTAGQPGAAWASGDPTNSSGGGGGAAGYIRINTRESGFSRAPGSIISPRPANGASTGIIGRR